MWSRMIEEMPRMLAEIRRKWPGSTLDRVKVSKNRIYLFFRINGVNVKAILYPAKGWKVRVYSPLQGVNIALKRLLERWIEGARKRREKPV